MEGSAQHVDPVRFLTDRLGGLDARQARALNEAEVQSLAHEGLWICAQDQRAPAGIDERPPGNIVVYGGLPLQGDEDRRYDLASLLYAHSTVIGCPFLNDIGRPAPWDTPETQRAALAEAVELWSYLKPLIEAKIVFPVGLEGKISDADARAALRRDLEGAKPLIAAYERGGLAEEFAAMGMSQAMPYLSDSEFPASLRILRATERFHGAIQDCAAWRCRYAPPSAYESLLLQRQVELLAQRLRVSAIFRAVGEVTLPLFEGLVPHDILAIRRDEAAFEDWRLLLASCVSQVESLDIARDSFLSDAEAIFEETLLPAARAVHKDVRKSKVLMKSAKTRAVDVGITITAVAGAAETLGQPALPTAFVAAGIVGTMRAVHDVLYAPSPSGSSGVLLRLFNRPV